MKFIYALLFAIFLSFNLNAADFNYGIVDYQKVLQSSKAFASFQKQIDVHKKTLEDQFSKEGNTLAATEKELVEKREEWSKTEFERRRKDLETKATAFRSNVESKQKAFDTIAGDVVRSIEQQTQKLIAEVTKEKNYEVVYQAAILASFPKERDISEEVLKRLDKAMPSVTVKKP